MAYPALTDVEAAATQTGVGYWPALAYAALNGVLITGSVNWMNFQAAINQTWAAWTSPASAANPGIPQNPQILSPNLPIDVYYAYITDMGAYPPSAQVLLNWAQGAGLVNNLGVLISLPNVGFGYPPGSGQNMNGTPTQNPSAGGTPPAGTPTTTANPFDFGSFFGMLQTNPSGAISTYPGAAAVSGAAALWLAKQTGVLHL